MFDTNVIISAFLFPASVPAQSLVLGARHHEIFICATILRETRAVVERKWPHRTGYLESFLFRLPFSAIPVPEGAHPEMADIKDAPILHAAIDAQLDILVSGYKHFLSLGREKPEIMSPKQFLDSFGNPPGL